MGKANVLQIYLSKLESSCIFGGLPNTINSETGYLHTITWALNKVCLYKLLIKLLKFLNCKSLSWPEPNLFTYFYTLLPPN